MLAIFVVGIIVSIIALVALSPIATKIVANNPLPTGTTVYNPNPEQVPDSAVASSTGPPTMTLDSQITVIDETTGNSTTVPTSDDYVYLNFGTGKTAVGEKARSGSTLSGLPVTGESVLLSKVGEPNGNITFGILDNNGDFKTTFGVVNATTLSNSIDVSYTKTGSEYVTADNDRIGLKFTQLNSTSNYAGFFNSTLSQYGNVPHHSDFDSNTFTITFFVKAFPNQDASDVFVSHANGSATNQWGFTTSQGTDLKWTVRNGTGSQFTVLYDPLPKGTWQQVTGRFNGTHVSLFANGVSVGNKAFVGSYTPANTPIRVAAAANAVTALQTMQIDNLRYYNTALTDQQISDLFFKGSSPDTYLKGFWKFNTITVVPTNATATIATTSTSDGMVTTDSATGTACPSSTYTKDTITSPVVLRAPASSGSAPCQATFMEVNTSTIPAGSTITAASLKINVTSVTSGRNCDITPMTNRPTTTSSGSTLWTDIHDGSAYVSNNSFCTTTGVKTISLGSSAMTDLQNNLSNGWFAVGIKLTNETRDTTNHQISIAPQESSASAQKPQLIVNYTTNAKTITDATGNSHTMTLTNSPTLVGSTVGDYVKVGAVSTDIFDGVVSALSDLRSGVWTDTLTKEMYMNVTATSKPSTNSVDGSTTTYWQNGIDQESGAYIYFDQGESRPVACISLKNEDSTHIPAIVSVYVTDNLTDWGDPFTTTVPVQNANWQTITVSNDGSAVGRYVVIQIDDWGSAKSWKLDEVAIAEQALSIIGAPDQGSVDAYHSVSSMGIAAFVLLGLGIAIAVLVKLRE